MTTVAVSFKLEKEDLRKINMYCINKRVSRSELIRTALKEYLKKRGIDIDLEY